jgi:hypothetical protein
MRDQSSRHRKDGKGGRRAGESRNAEVEASRLI